MQNNTNEYLICFFNWIFSLKRGTFLLVWKIEIENEYWNVLAWDFQRSLNN